MSKSPFEMKFDPQTINHLGVRMYSNLPAAISELISNAYDADASKVTIKLTEDTGVPSEVRVSDDGCGLNHDEINTKLLIIGRNRRTDEGDKAT